MLKKQVLKKIDLFQLYIVNRKRRFICEFDSNEDNKIYLDMIKFFDDIVYKVITLKSKYDTSNKIDYTPINTYLMAMNNGTHTSNHYKRTNLYRIKNKWIMIKREINTLIGDD